MPALLTRMSMRPCSRDARAAAAATAASSVSSTASPLTRAERRQRAARLRRARAASMSHSTTVGARAQHALGGGVADALRAAGDDGDAALQVDLVHRVQSLQGLAGVGPRRAVVDVLAHDVGEARLGLQAEARRARCASRRSASWRRCRRCARRARSAPARAPRGPATASSASSISPTRTLSAGRFSASAAVEARRGSPRRPRSVPSTVRAGDDTGCDTLGDRPGRSPRRPASGSRMMPLKNDEAAPFGLPGRTVTVISRAARPSMKPLRV